MKKMMANNESVNVKAAVKQAPAKPKGGYVGNEKHAQTSAAQSGGSRAEAAGTKKAIGPGTTSMKDATAHLAHHHSDVYKMKI